MSTLSETSAVALDGVATARTAATCLDADGTPPMIVDALGQESVDQLMASAQSVVNGAAAAAEALHDSIKFDSIGVKADELMDSHGHESEVTDHSDISETVDVDKLRAATAKFQDVVGQADGLTGVLEGILGDERVRSRLREGFAAKDDGADLEAIKGALASVHPGSLAISGVVGGVIDQVTAASKELPADLQEAMAHLEESLNGSLQDLSRLIERLRDVAIAAVDGLS